MGASPKESTSTQLQAPGPGRRAWELGPGTRIQHPGDLEAGPDSGGHLGRGRGLASGSWDSGQGRKFCTGPRAVPKPAGCQRSSSSTTPGPTVSFPAARAFWFRASPHAGLAPALAGQPLGNNATKSRRGAFAAGLTLLVPGVGAPPPLRGVRAPQSSPNGNPARLGTGAGGTASVGLGNVCHLTGRERQRGAASPRGSSGGKVPRMQRKWDGDAGRPSPRQLGFRLPLP